MSDEKNEGRDDDRVEERGATLEWRTTVRSSALYPADELAYPQLPEGQPVPYPGGKVRGDVVPTWLYIATIRAELAQLLLLVDLYRRNVDNPDCPGTFPRRIHLCAMGLFRYHRAWSFNLDDQDPMKWPTLWDGRIWVEKLTQRLWPENDARGVDAVLARAVAPETIASCEGILAIWPRITLGRVGPDGLPLDPRFKPEQGTPGTLPMHGPPDAHIPEAATDALARSSVIDYIGMADMMRAKRAALPAAFVEYMADRDQASRDDAIRAIYKTAHNKDVRNPPRLYKAFDRVVARARVWFRRHKTPLNFTCSGGVVRKIADPFRAKRA
jgi:hypothetical protein